MTTLSIPINQELEDFINQMISENKAENKAELVRRALYEFREAQLLNDVAQARAEATRGEVFSGDLRQVAARLRQHD